MDYKTLAAFETLRLIYERSMKLNARNENHQSDKEFTSYAIELAKSARSKCTAKAGNGKVCLNSAIEKDSIRIGSISIVTGKYGNWVHLNCWKVPLTIGKRLPDPLKCHDSNQFLMALQNWDDGQLTGFNDLPLKSQSQVIQFVMNNHNWIPHVGPLPKSIKKTNPKHKFDPISTYSLRNAPTDVLKNIRIVLSGTFPELGGGIGLSLGKDQMKKLLESFGARVTAMVTSLTDILVVGKDPGFQKVNEARKNRVKILGFSEVLMLIKGKRLELLPTPIIKSLFLLIRLFQWLPQQ